MINGANTLDLHFDNKREHHHKDLLSNAQKQSQHHQNYVTEKIATKCEQSKSSKENGHLNGFNFIKLKHNDGQIFLFNNAYYNNNNNNINVKRNENQNQKIDSNTSVIPATTTVTNIKKNVDKGYPDLAWCTPSKRTRAQENTFRCIEDVHNYAKLNQDGYTNDSSSSSMMQDDDEDNDEDYIEDSEYLNLMQDGQQENFITYSTSKQRSVTETYQNNKNHASDIHDDDDSEMVLDVETVSKELDYDFDNSIQIIPDHHARRPMNAFLIFCKRHRAIVKDRYRTLENRAITKILGDWWATLDVSEKKPFTNLAKQNKDAFFSANPNFKWYKLPAPPLRTLNTRPSNSEQRTNDSRLVASPQFSSKSEYFKFADETQMGELKSLMSRNVSNKTNDKTCPLQQALSETTHFLNEHMPPQQVKFHSSSTFEETLQEQNSFHNISSNSSDETPTTHKAQRKLSRSCKGKIYQELVNSGQIASIAKKLRNTNTTSEIATSQSVTKTNAQAHVQLERTRTQSTGFDQRLSYSETEAGTHDLQHFDLEERIKELPALCLETYLQQKRNTKKKRKFTTKKRNSSPNFINQNANELIKVQEQWQTQINKQQQQVVGSQKRKARKESITRRDVSAIENEVAALITSSSAAIKNCYFFNESTAPAAPADTIKSEIANIDVFATNTLSKSNLNETAFADADNLTVTSSDLFILAEVAAKRTELMQ